MKASGQHTLQLNSPRESNVVGIPYKSTKFQGGVV
jgi:hypothetical protein